MNPRTCDEFQDWLERLPRREPSPAFRRHADSCPACRRRMDELDAVAEALIAVTPQAQLEPARLTEMTRTALQEATRRQDQKTGWRLAAVSLACLPLLILVNWAWGAVGYGLLAHYVSAFLAQIYLVLFVPLALGLGALSYGSLPLLAGLMRGRSQEETTR